MPSSSKGRVLFIGSGPYRISQETRGNLFAHSCLAFLRENSIPFVIMDNDAAGPLMWEGAERVIRGPLDAAGIRSALESVKPSRVWPICAGKEAQALLVEALEESGRGELLPGGTGAYRAAADWKRFREVAEAAGAQAPFGRVATSIEGAAAVAAEVGFPLFLSTSRSRGGGGARIVYNYEELAAQVGTLLSWSIGGEVLVVRVYERHAQCEVHVMRDAAGGIEVVGITDALTPLGVHVANATNVYPAESLTPEREEKVRAAAVGIAEKSGLVGYAVIHFGLDAQGGAYAVGMRAGFAVSSYILALGRGLDIARAATAAAFGKPVKDAVGPAPEQTLKAVSSSRFQNYLFPGASDAIGSHKISTGAGIGVAESFAPAFLTAVSSARVGQQGLFEAAKATAAEGGVLPHLAAPRTNFLADVVAAILKGHKLEEISAASGISVVYLAQLEKLAREWKASRGAATPECGRNRAKIRRDGAGGKALVVVGPPARGVGEADGSCVFLRDLCRAYRARGCRLVFAGWRSHIPLDLFFDASEVYCGEPAEALAEALSGGNTNLVYIDPRNVDAEELARKATAAGATIVGVEPERMWLGYDRKALAGILPRVGLTLKEGQEIAEVEQARRAAAVYGYPMLLRHKGGDPKAIIAYNEAQLEDFVRRVKTTITAERFLEDMVEVAVVVLSDGKDARAAAVLEMLEETGISSTDRASALPSFSIAEHSREMLAKRAEALVAALSVKGVLTVRLGMRYDVPYFLSAALGPSREVPFAASARGADIIGAAAAVFDGAALDEAWREGEGVSSQVYVRQPVFSFGRFPGSDTVLGTRPRSTGDVVGEGANFALAFAAARRSAGRPLPTGGTAFLSVRDRDKRVGVMVGRQLKDLGFKLVATDGTARALASAGVEARMVYRVSEGRPNVVDLLKNREITLVIYTPTGGAPREDEVQIRTIAWSFGIPVITTAGEALAAVGAMEAMGA